MYIPCQYNIYTLRLRDKSHDREQNNSALSEAWVRGAIWFETLSGKYFVGTYHGFVYVNLT